MASLQRALTQATDGRTRDDSNTRVVEAAHQHQINTLEALLADCRAHVREKEVSLQRVQAQLDAVAARRTDTTASEELRSSLTAKETLISELRTQVRELLGQARLPASQEPSSAAVDEQRRRMDQLESMVCGQQ